MSSDLASLDDMEAVLSGPVPDAELVRIARLISIASTELRQKCPFDIDARIALFAVTPSAATALNPLLVGNVVATLVKRVLDNPQGLASSSETVGPYSRSRSFVTRNENPLTQGAIQVTPGDIDRLRPSSPRSLPRVVTLSPSRRMTGPLPYGVWGRVDPVTGLPVPGDY